MKILRYFAIGLAAVILIFLYQLVSSPLVTTVSGVGSVSAPASMATITFSLTSSKGNSTDAASEVKINVDRIKSTLKTSGIPDSDIYQSQITIYPASAVTAGATGFSATTSMGIKTSRVSNLDNIISSLYAMGATVVTQPVLEVGDKTNLDSQAYDLALKDARNKANIVASKNWKFFKKIILIQETTTPTTSTVTSAADSVTQIDKNISAGTGVIKVSKVLSVSYKMW